MTLWLPALYIAFTSYNPEIVRVQIALLIGEAGRLCRILHLLR